MRICERRRASAMLMINTKEKKNKLNVNIKRLCGTFFNYSTKIDEFLWKTNFSEWNQRNNPLWELSSKPVNYPQSFSNSVSYWFFLNNSRNMKKKIFSHKQIHEHMQHIRIIYRFTNIFTVVSMGFRWLYVFITFEICEFENQNRI